MKILIAEDEQSIAELMRIYLADCGEADIAGNGKEALKAYRTALKSGKPYDLILLDIMMPKMDGHDVLRKIRDIEDDRDIPLGQGVRIVMTTALGDEQNVTAAFSELCDAYLVKPISKAHLLDKIRSFGLID